MRDTPPPHDADPAPDADPGPEQRAVERELGDQYQFVCTLRRGAFGAVYLARERRLRGSTGYGLPCGRCATTPWAGRRPELSFR